jgi:hypothetical protein
LLERRKMAKDHSPAPPEHDCSVAPNSCSNCRRLHKKCDKVLPNCGECAKKNKKCVYEAIVRKSKREEIPRVGALPPSAKNSPTNFLFAQDTCYQGNFMFRLFMDLPFLKQREMEDVLDYITAELRGDSYLQHRPPDMHLALIYSMQAAFKRCYGKIDIGAYFFEKARVALSERFYDAINDFAVAASFDYLALYCGMNGELSRAQFFLQNTHNYLEHWKNNEGRHSCYEFLRFMYNFVASALSDSDNLETQFKELISHQLMVRRHYLSTRDPLLKIVVDTDLGDINEEALKNDIEQRKSDYTIGLPHLELIAARLSAMFDRLYLSGLASPAVKSKKLFYSLYYQGLIIERAIKAGTDSGCRDAADTIVVLARKPEFADLPGTVFPIINYASNYHLAQSKNTSDMTDLLQLAEYMKIELLAFNKMGQDTVLYKLRAEDIAEKLSAELRRIDELLTMARFDNFLTRPMEPVNTFRISPYWVQNEQSMIVPVIQQEEITTVELDEFDLLFQ